MQTSRCPHSAGISGAPCSPESKEIRSVYATNLLPKSSTFRPTRAQIHYEGLGERDSEPKNLQLGSKPKNTFYELPVNPLSKLLKSHDPI